MSTKTRLNAMARTMANTPAPIRFVEPARYDAMRADGTLPENVVRKDSHHDTL